MLSRLLTQNGLRPSFDAKYRRLANSSREHYDREDARTAEGVGGDGVHEPDQMGRVISTEAIYLA
jgi:hypothetical protein